MNMNVRTLKYGWVIAALAVVASLLMISMQSCKRFSDRPQLKEGPELVLNIVPGPISDVGMEVTSSSSGNMQWSYIFKGGNFLRIRFDKPGGSDKWKGAETIQFTVRVNDKQAKLSVVVRGEECGSQEIVPIVVSAKAVSGCTVKNFEAGSCGSRPGIANAAALYIEMNP